MPVSLPISMVLFLGHAISTRASARYCSFLSTNSASIQVAEPQPLLATNGFLQTAYRHLLWERGAGL